MKKLLLVLLTLTVQISFSQAKEFYKDAVNDCIVSPSKDAAMLNDIVENCVKGKYISNYDFTTIDGKVISTDKVDKPILLIVAATWCAPCWGEIPALNKMVEKYNGQMEFVMLFWDQKKGAERMAKKLDKRIQLVASSEENSDKSTVTINGFIHKLDYPTAYLISKDKQIINFKRGAASPSKKMGWDEVNKINEKQLEEFLKPVLQ
ncbi:TlpA family protein disulfide reductase [Tenacibaculum halocynthiae]|uniref:TlpA family protein disulfide reductase n=1 Tax=Tenacibaculum halocynthiae TaxID=1254437 RepID=UPI003D6597B2